MNISNKTLRNILRAVHLMIAGLISAYLYTPLGSMEWFEILVKVTVMPVLVTTGVSMWQMPFLTKLFKRQPAPAQS